MSRSLHADFTTRFAQDDQGIVFNAVKIGTATPIYISNAYDVHTVDGNSYTPYGQLLRLPTFDEWPLGDAGMNISIANFDDFFSAINDEYLNRIVVTVYEVIADNAGAVVNFRSLFVGRLDIFGWGEEWATMTIRPGSSLGARMTPRYDPVCWRRFAGIALSGARFSCIYDGVRSTDGPSCNKTFEDCNSMVFAATQTVGPNSVGLTCVTGGDWDIAKIPQTVTVQTYDGGGGVVKVQFWYDPSTPTTPTDMGPMVTTTMGPLTPYDGDGWTVKFNQVADIADVGDTWTFQVNNRVNFGGERFCPKPGDTIIFGSQTSGTSYVIPELPEWHGPEWWAENYNPPYTPQVETPLVWNPDTGEWEDPADQPDKYNT